jgi:hypothetical protein
MRKLPKADPDQYDLFSYNPSYVPWIDKQGRTNEGTHFYTEARAIHAVYLRDEGFKLREIAARFPSTRRNHHLSIERARQLIYKGTRILRRRLHYYDIDADGTIISRA